MANVSEETCNRTHDALGIELKGIKDRITSLSNRMWGMQLTLILILGGITTNVVIVWK